jgi:aminopeptidase
MPGEARKRSISRARIIRNEFASRLRSPADMDDRLDALAELAVHGANVQRGQVVAVGATTGQEELARAVAKAAYRRGALFVDVTYFDPYVKRMRIEYADPETLTWVPPWYGHRVEQLAERGDARIALAGVVDPSVFDGLDPALLGKDQLPGLKETSRIVGERWTNWTIVPCPHPVWAKLVYPELDEAAAYERLWDELIHVLRLDEPDPTEAWEERVTALNRCAEALTERRFDAVELSGPGTELTVGLFDTGTWVAGDFTTRNGLRHLPNLPTEEVFTTPDPVRTQGHVTSTKPLVLKDGTIVRGLRVSFENGRAVDVDADENAGAIRARTDVDEGAARLGELALVDRHGRIGPLGTIFFDTLLDENAVSHIAFGFGFPFAVAEDQRDEVNQSEVHIDFMIGSPELDVTGVTAEGERVPVLRNGDWQV